MTPEQFCQWLQSSAELSGSTPEQLKSICESAMQRTSSMIEALVQMAYGASDLRTQHDYSLALQTLVDLAKAEQLMEITRKFEEREFSYRVL